MGINEFFEKVTKAPEKRHQLLMKFCEAIDGSLSRQPDFEAFVAGNLCILSHDKHSFGIMTKSFLHREISRNPSIQVIDLSELPGYKKVIDEYLKLKQSKIEWEKIYLRLGDVTGDLLFEAVKLFESKYGLPKLWT